MVQAQQKSILVAEDDEELRIAIGRFLEACDYKVILAANGRQALELCHELGPHLLLLDVRMPDITGIELLEKLRKAGNPVPVIIMTGFPDLETSISAIQNGAFDYIVKPLHLDILQTKIAQAFTTADLSAENAVLNELASLHDITSRLSNIHQLDKLLKVALQCCLDVSGAESGSIQLVNTQRGTLSLVREKGLGLGNELPSAIIANENTISGWVARHGLPLLIVDGKTVPELPLKLDRRNIGSAISVPLKVDDRVIGVVNMNKDPEQEPFNRVQLNTIEVLAAQAGIAINNANLYSSVHQRLQDLSLISTFSEQLMGLVDKEDIVKCLFETVHNNFAVDLVSYLSIQKRSGLMLYWSRCKPPNTLLSHICDQIVGEYNQVARSSLNRRRVTMQAALAPADLSRTLSRELLFSHVVFLSVEMPEYGVLFLGAEKKLADQSDQLSLILSLINQTRIALTNAKLFSDMKENYIRTIKALAIAVDAKDTYTHGHSENVMNIAEQIARQMELSRREIEVVRDSGLLHDIGKIGIPGYILNKPGALTYEEFNGVMKSHSLLGANIVRDVPFLHDLYELILYHHEHYDGNGYPEGLSGEQIPLGARIIHVADAFEAMTSNRPYRKSLGRDEALRRLRSGRGKQFDPEVVDAFLALSQQKGWLHEERKVVE